jgi:nucleoside-diphosphate-sugar epimerase
MKVLIAGASGAVGRPLVRQLLAGGHEVIAMTRSSRNADELQALGATPVTADALDRRSVRDAVAAARPSVVVHQLSALTGAKDYKHFDREFAMTNRLRKEGTDHLLEAARAAGVRRVIAQSYGNWNYERTGSGPKTEEDALDPAPPRNQRETLAAIRYLEKAVLGTDPIEGVILRYGNLYGTGTGFAINGDIVARIRKRALPIVGDGAGVWSFTHVDDAASAVLATLGDPAAGVYNIVDDEPAPVAVWLPELARAVGAKPPWRVPTWVGRLAVGEVGVSLMTRIRGASNAKARRELGWSPKFPSWREGFWTGLGESQA